MSIIIFFGSCFLVLCVSTIYVVVGIRHLIKTRKDASLPAAIKAEELL